MSFTAKLTENVKIYILQAVKLPQSTNKIKCIIYVGLKINIFEEIRCPRGFPKCIYVYM